MKNILLYVAALSCIMTAACQQAVPDGFRVDNPENYSKIYLGNAFHGNVNMTLLPGQDTVLKVYANYGGLLDLDGPVAVTFEARPEMVAEYNETMRTGYEPLPLSNFLLEHRTVTIPAGGSSSDAMRVCISSEGLSGRGPYLLPVTIEKVSGKDCQVNQDLKTLYVIMDYDDSSIDFPCYERTAWNVLECSGHDGDAVPESVLDGDRHTCWTCSDSTGHVLAVDMRRPLLMHGIGFTSRLRIINGNEYHYAGQPASIHVEVSDDNQEWTTVLEDATVPFGIESSLRFGKYIKARYVKITVLKTWITKNHTGNSLSFSEFKVF